MNLCVKPKTKTRKRELLTLVLNRKKNIVVERSFSSHRKRLRVELLRIISLIRFFDACCTYYLSVFSKTKIKSPRSLLTKASEMNSQFSKKKNKTMPTTTKTLTMSQIIIIVLVCFLFRYCV